METSSNIEKYIDGDYDNEIKVIKKEIVDVFHEHYDRFMNELKFSQRFNRNSENSNLSAVTCMFADVIEKRLSIDCLRIMRTHSFDFTIEINRLIDCEPALELVFVCRMCSNCLRNSRKHNSLRKFYTFDRLKKHFMSKNHYEVLIDELKFYNSLSFNSF